MKFLQLYYTSCQRGRTPGSGFQVYAASEGLSEQEILEIERYGVYIPPSHLPGHPTEEEIKQAFPMAFSTFQLSSGRHGVCQSVYTGKDYSGRYGNYFSHAIILDEGEWPFDPVLLYNSPTFRKGLTMEEQLVDREPAPLPSLSAITKGGDVTPSKVDQFLDSGDRRAQLKKMLDVLIAEKGQAGSLYLTDETPNIPFWIAAIRLSFPIQIASSLFFSTYSFDPERENFVINGTMDKGTRFNFRDHANQYYVFNMNVPSRDNAVPKTFTYSERAATDSSFLNQIKEFFTNFDYRKVNEEIDSAIVLYEMEHAGKSLLSTKEWLEGISFARKYLRPERTSHFMDRLSAEQLYDIASRCDIPTGREIALFLFESANKTKKAPHLEKAVDFFLQVVDDLMTNAEDTATIRNIEQFFCEVYDPMKERRTFHEAFLHPERLDERRAALREFTHKEKMDFYHKRVIDMVVEEGYAWESLYESQKLFIVGDLSKDSTLYKEVNGYLFAKSMLFWQSRGASEFTVMHVLENALRGRAEDAAWLKDAYEVLEQEEIGREWLYRAYVKNLEAAGNKTDYVKSYVKEMYPYKKYLSYYLKKILTLYKNSAINQKSLFEMERLFADTTIPTALDKYGLLKGLLLQGEWEIPFHDEYVESNQDFLQLFHEKYKEVTGIHHPKLALIFYILSVRQKDPERSSKLLTVNIQALDEREYKEFLVWSLPVLIDEYYKGKTIITTLIEKMDREMFRPLIFEALTEARENNKMKFSPNFFVECFYLYHREKQAPTKKVEMQMKEYLLAYPSEIKKVDDLIKGLDRDVSLQKKWSAIYKEVEKQQGNIFSRSMKKIIGKR
ncbi:hypothetical protein ACQCT5_07025 [Sutcliffiella halmapala]